MPARAASRGPSSAATIAGDLRGLAAACEAFPDAIVDVALPAVGARMKALAFDEAARVSGGDRRLSHFARGRGITLDAGYDKSDATTMTLTPRPLGPWTLVEAGSHRSHWYEPRAGVRNSRRRGGRPIRLRDGGVRWYARHGPVRGKQAWSRTKTRIGDELPDMIHTAAVDAWAQVRKAAA